jgi:hypothetical protein
MGPGAGSVEGTVGKDEVFGWTYNSIRSMLMRSTGFSRQTTFLIIDPDRG